MQTMQQPVWPAGLQLPTERRARPRTMTQDLGEYMARMDARFQRIDARLASVESLARSIAPKGL